MDLGQQREFYLKHTVRLSAPESFWVKVRPYLGKKRQSDVIRAGLDPEHLILTLHEAINLDKAFNVSSNIRISQSFAVYA